MSILPAHDLPDTGVSDKLGHALAYGLLTFWFAGAYRHTSLVFIALASFCLGLGLEGLQSLTATRAPEFADLFANLFGIVVAALLAASGGRGWCAIVEDYLR